MEVPILKQGDFLIATVQAALTDADLLHFRTALIQTVVRRRSQGVAEHSQHILGRAMDTTMPGMPMERIREIGRASCRERV